MTYYSYTKFLEFSILNSYTKYLEEELGLYFLVALLFACLFSVPAYFVPLRSLTSEAP